MSGGYSGWASWAIGEQIVQEAVAIVVAANGGGSDGGQVGRIDGDLEVAYRGGDVDFSDAHAGATWAQPGRHSRGCGG